MLSIPPSVLATLPAASRAKLEAADDTREAATAAYRGAREREDEARKDWQFAYSTAQSQLENVLPGKGYHAAEAQVMEPVHLLKEAVERRTNARMLAAERQREHAYLDEVEAWLNRTARLGGSHFRPTKAMTAKSKDPVRDVTKLRDRLAEIERVLAKVIAAPAPKADLLARCFREIDEVAAQGELRVRVGDRGASPLDLAARLSDHFGQRRGFAGLDGLSIFVWMLQDDFKAKLRNAIDALPDEQGCTDDERDAAIADLVKERLKVERDEAVLIEQAASEGTQITQRRNVDPRAFLGIDA